MKLCGMNGYYEVRKESENTIRVLVSGELWKGSLVTDTTNGV